MNDKPKDIGYEQDERVFARIEAMKQQPAHEPVAWGIVASNTGKICQVELDAEEVAQHNQKYVIPLYTRPQPAAWVGLNEREIELLDGMIEVQLDHARRCDSIGNRTMAEKQFAWDMERVALLTKLREKNGGNA